jgi:adenylate kinase
MLEQATREGLRLERDGLRQLPRADRERLRSQAIRDLPDSCILDIHLSTQATQGLEPALPAELLDRPLGCIIILQAEPAIVLERRASRAGRSDPHDTLEDIAKQQAFNLSVARSLKASSVVVIDAGRPIQEVVRDLDAALEQAGAAPRG